MINAATLIQLKAFARIDGLIMGVTWLLSMWFILYRTDSIWGITLMLCTPFFIGWRLKSFRDNALEGIISFRRACCFCCYIFFYASIIFALGQVVYLKFIDGGTFIAAMQNSIDTMKPIYSEQGLSTADMDATMDIIKLMSPVDLTFVFFMQNLFIGLFISPLLAIIYKRQNR